MSHIVYTGISVTHTQKQKRIHIAFIYLFMFLIIRVNSADHMASLPLPPRTTIAIANLTFVLASKVFG